MKHLEYTILYGFLLIVFGFFAACNSEQRETELNYQAKAKLSPEAPEGTNILGQLVGAWDAEQTIMNRDGTWDAPKHSIWKWYYILDGHAIQDDWISIDSLNNEIPVGTNIRIYNPDEKQWHMAWIDKTNRRLATFTAINDSGTVVMEGTNAKGRHIKNTFFNIADNEFDWKQEWTFDEGKTWVVVAKIHCKRKL
jgi:hypothetical protein